MDDGCLVETLATLIARMNGLHVTEHSDPSLTAPPFCDAETAAAPETLPAPPRRPSVGSTHSGGEATSSEATATAGLAGEGGATEGGNAGAVSSDDDNEDEAAARRPRSRHEMQTAIALLQEQCRLLVAARDQVALARERTEQRIAATIDTLSGPPRPMATEAIADDLSGSARASTLVVRRFADAWLRLRHREAQAVDRAAAAARQQRRQQQVSPADARRLRRAEELAELQEREQQLQEECIRMVRAVRDAQQRRDRGRNGMKLPERRATVVIADDVMRIEDSGAVVKRKRAILRELQVRHTQLRALLQVRTGEALADPPTASKALLLH